MYNPLRYLVLVLLGLGPLVCSAVDAPRRFAVAPRPDDVLATGNEWLALPDIRSSDGALGTFNVLSWRDRGLLQAAGEAARPVLEPYFSADGRKLSLHDPAWELLEYWIPQARQSVDDIELTLTYCAPNGYRAAFIRLTATNHRAVPATVALGLKSSFGSLSRVTYLPVTLRGERTVGPSPWVDPGEVFSYLTNDTKYSWAIVHPESKATVTVPPQSVSPEVDAARTVVLQPGASSEALFVLAAGVEEFSAAHNARSLREMLDRYGSEAMLAQAAAWCRARTRTTGHADLDLLMNRNFLFTALYAWGRTIDTEQLVGVTSRSPRYYVSAAYWDRDAMIWSFPGLLDSDPGLAREALDYALTVQLRNSGTHSRFIDGIVLEDGFQLDEAVAPILALAAYVEAAHDEAFLTVHRDALLLLRDRLLGRFDPQLGLYSSLQDSQDEFQKLPFITYDNVLSWRALLDMAGLFRRLHDGTTAADLGRRASALHAAILAHCVTATAPGAAGPMFASATDGAQFAFTDIPPGSLMKLPALGFIAEDDPVFVRTYDWLHSSNYAYSYSDQKFGLPGSYRLPITTSWVIADELLLKRGHERAASILRASSWDNGIISEGIDPATAQMDHPGRAFATAAGYVAHAICRSACTKP